MNVKLTGYGVLSDRTARVIRVTKTLIIVSLGGSSSMRFRLSDGYTPGAYRFSSYRIEAKELARIRNGTL